MKDPFNYCTKTGAEKNPGELLQGVGSAKAFESQ